MGGVRAAAGWWPGCAVPIPLGDRQAVEHTVSVIAKTQWRVAIHNDRVNSFAVVVHLVHTLCAKTLEDAAQVATHAHHHGTAEVAAFRERDRAEQLVVALQRRGLNTTIRRA